MITRLICSRSLAYRTCLVYHTETYATKIPAVTVSKPETSRAAKKVTSKRILKPKIKRASEHEAGGNSENDEDTLPDKITASTKFTLNQWKEYGGKIYEKRLKYLVKAKNVSKNLCIVVGMRYRGSKV